MAKFIDIENLVKLVTIFRFFNFNLSLAEFKNHKLLDLLHNPLLRYAHP